MMKRALPKTISLIALAAVTLPSTWAQGHQKPSTAGRPNQVLDGAATLWMDPTRWTGVLSAREDTLIFIHQDSVAHGRLIFKPEGKPAEAQAQEILERVRKVSPAAKFIFEEPRKVNGVDVHCFQIEAPQGGGSPMIYYGYVYGDERISIQVFGLVELANLGKYYLDLTGFLNGLEIAQDPKPLDP